MLLNNHLTDGVSFNLEYCWSCVITAICLSTQRVWHTFSYDITVSNGVNLCRPVPFLSVPGFPASPYCCHKTTWAIILITPIYFLEASGAPVFTLQQGSWITVHKSWFCHAVLSQRATGCGLHNSVKLGRVFTGIELEFVLRHPGGVDLTVTEHFSC